MAGMSDFQTAFNNAVNSGGGFSTNNGVTTLTDKSGKTIGTYDRAGNLMGAPSSSPAPSSTFNQDTPGPNWNGNVTSSPGVTNFGVTYHDPSGVVNLGGNQWEQGAAKDFQQSGLNPNQQNNWMQAFINAHRQDGQALSSSNAVNNNWNFFSQDARPDTQDSFLLQGPNGLKSGQSELMTDSGTGQAYYVANVNGQLMKGAVPDALSPEFGNNGQANMSVPSVWNPDGSLKSMGTGSIGAIPSSLGSRSSSSSMPSLFPAFTSANSGSSTGGTLAKPAAPSPVNLSPTLQSPTVTNMNNQQVPVAQLDPASLGVSNDYLNNYWTSIKNQGHTSREVKQGEDLNTVRQNEASLYQIDPSQVKVVNSGGHTYVQVPWNLAQNHAQQQSLAELAQQQGTQAQQSQTSPVSGVMQAMQQLGFDPNAIAQQAQAQYNTQAQQIQDIINQDVQQQQSQDALLQNQLNNSVGSLNNTTFQDWLKAREGIAQRGLANSGLMNDAMVRTQLGAQDKMQGLYNTFLDNLTKGDAQYQNDILKQQQALESLNPAAIQQTLTSNELKDLTPFLPYIMPTADQTAQLTGMLNGQPTLANINDQQTWANNAAKLALQQAGLSGFMPDGTPTAALLNQIGTQTGQYYNPLTGKWVQTETAQKNNADTQFKYDQLSLAKWFDQQKVADMQANTNIAQGRLDLARQDAAQKNFIAQEGINDTRTSTMLKGYTDQMSTDISGMDSILKANGGVMPDKTKNPQAYQDYQDLYNKYLTANQGFNDSFTGYTQNMGK